MIISKVGHLLLSNCRYACEKPPIKKLLYVEDESLTEGPELLSEDSNELDFDSSPDVPPVS